MTSILNSRGFTAWKNGRNPCQRMCRWVLQGRLITCPMFDQIAVCQSESSVLSSLRDLLLPRLISGKLRVAEAESLIEEAIA